MLLKALQLGALAVLPGGIKPLEIFANDNKNSVLTKIPDGAVTGNPLRFPPPFTNGGTMTLARSNIQVFPSLAMTQTIAINGSYPGPTVRLLRGATLTVHFQNNLTEPATIHWHGIAAPELMDGHPKDSVAPGGSYIYTYQVTQRAGTYFYHSHADMLTGKHVYKGCAGFFIVDDPAENTFGLPDGNYDIPLLIQDRRAADIPQFTYNPGMTALMDGYLGDTPLVNGTPNPYFNVDKTTYRFRILNGSNARVYKIAIVDGGNIERPFTVISTDGGLKDYPAAAVTSFLLSPAERVEIVFDFSSYSIGQSLTLKSQAFGSWTGTYHQGIAMNLLRFDITGNGNSGGSVPTAFNPITYYNPADVTTTHQFVLTMVGGSKNIHKINGHSFNMNNIEWQTPLYALEEWKIFNASPGLHPMHAHGMQFQIYSRNGNTNLEPNDKGWKDTVLVNPDETVKTLVKFNDYKGIFLYHCHNLEHEDDGMMLNIKVIDSIGIHREGTEVPEAFSLHQNYPNPFNLSTKIKFEIPTAGINRLVFTKLVVYNSQGSEVITLAHENLSPGIYSVEWDASGLSSGTYLCKIEARPTESSTGEYNKTIKMSLVK